MVDDEFVRKAKPACCCCCCLAVTITSIVLAVVSWQSVSQGEMALFFSHYAQSVKGPPIVEPGLHYVGPLNHLVKYPSVYQMLYFDRFDNYEKTAHEMVKPPILSRTYDGLKVGVKVSFQWKMDPQHLMGIFAILGSAEDLQEDKERPEEKPSFVEALTRFARGTLTRVCAQYTASEFFANQTLVQATMFEELVKTFNRPEQNFVISVQGLQLRSVDLPNEYESAIADTQQQEQDFETATAERATKEMQQSTIVMQATQQVFELRKAASANASKIYAENAAWVEQYRFFQLKQAEAYALILQELKGATDPYESLFELMRQKALKEHQTDKMTLSM